MRDEDGDLLAPAGKLPRQQVDLVTHASRLWRWRQGGLEHGDAHAGIVRSAPSEPVAGLDSGPWDDLAYASPVETSAGKSIARHLRSSPRQLIELVPPKVGLPLRAWKNFPRVHGLHARPAARLVTLVRGFDARVELRNAHTGSAWVPASPRQAPGPPGSNAR